MRRRKQGRPMLKARVSERDWWRGPADAPVTVVEYADLQCPACYHSYPVIERVLGGFEGRVRFVFRQFPLVSVHPLAQGAALACEAAGRQGKFWEMHGRLMKARGKLKEVQLLRYAAEIGLDVQRWRRDLADRSLAERITRSKRLAVRSGVSGTPTLFINGLLYEGATDPVRGRELRAAIEQALAAAR